MCKVGNGGFPGAVLRLTGGRSRVAIICSRIKAPACAPSLTENVSRLVRARFCKMCRLAGSKDYS